MREKTQKVEAGVLVWVKSEVSVFGTSKKLNPKWHRVYRVEEVVFRMAVAE